MSPLNVTCLVFVRNKFIEKERCFIWMLIFIYLFIIPLEEFINPDDMFQNPIAKPMASPSLLKWERDLVLTLKSTIS